jgi:hypothetical protein
MRTVHEPDLSKSAALPEPTPTNRKSIKLKLANGSKSAAAKVAEPSVASAEDLQSSDPKDQNNNIRYVPAFHPVTGQAGFMIHYPADIVFTSRESDMAANELMRLLRRQLAWAEQEGAELKQELEELERQKRHEWAQKEVLLEGLMEAELTRSKKEGVFDTINPRVRKAIEEDATVGRGLTWTQGTPLWRGEAAGAPTREDVDMADVERRPRKTAAARQSVSPRTAADASGEGFDGDADPYDNILAGMMAEYEERERARSMANTPLQTSTSIKQRAAEVDAVGALLGMGMGKP